MANPSKFPLDGTQISHEFSRHRTSIQKQKQNKKRIYEHSIPKHCINHPDTHCLCVPNTLLEVLPEDTKISLGWEHIPFIDKKTGLDLCGHLPKLCIFTGETTVTQKCSEIAKQLSVEIYTLGKWQECFQKIKSTLFSYAVKRICSDDNLFELLSKINTKIEKLREFDVDFYRRNVKSYHTVRSLEQRYNWLPKIVLISATPAGITPCNILNKLMEYSSELKSQKLPKVLTTSVTDVLQALPGIDVTGVPISKEIVRALPEDLKRAIVNNTYSALKHNPELQDSTGVTLEDAKDQRYPSIVLCKKCGMSVSNLPSYIDSLSGSSLSLRHTNKKVMGLNPFGKIENFHKHLYINCFCCKKSYFSWDSIKTKFNQIFFDKKYILTIQKKLVIQALQQSFPNDIAFCPRDKCKGKEGFLIMMYNYERSYCNECKIVHRTKCIPGVNMVFCVTCNIAHHIDMHMAQCYDCGTRICTICKSSGSEYHTGRPCIGAILQHMDSATAQLLLADGTKICPGCKQGVTKTRDCDHMACPCGVHFCYRCNRNITLTGYSAHNCPVAGAVAGRIDEVFEDHYNNNGEFEHYDPAAFA